MAKSRIYGDHYAGKPVDQRSRPQQWLIRTITRLGSPLPNRASTLLAANSSSPARTSKAAPARVLDNEPLRLIARRVRLSVLRPPGFAFKDCHPRTATQGWFKRWWRLVGSVRGGDLTHIRVQKYASLHDGRHFRELHICAGITPHPNLNPEGDAGLCWSLPETSKLNETSRTPAFSARTAAILKRH